MKPDIIRRYSQNPILTKTEIPYPVETVHNAAVVKHEGQYIMLSRSHLRTGRSIIGLAQSRWVPLHRQLGNPFWFSHGAACLLLTKSSAEDPRVTRLEGEYFITYSAYSRNGVRIALAMTKDFQPDGKSLAHHGSGLSKRGDLSGEVRRIVCAA